jgi:hypothetical protein
MNFTERVPKMIDEVKNIEDINPGSAFVVASPFRTASPQQIHPSEEMATIYPPTMFKYARDEQPSNYNRDVGGCTIL